MAHAAGYTVGQQAGQGAVNRGVRRAENERQFRRIDERRPAEGVEQLSVRDGHVLSVAKESSDGQPCAWNPRSSERRWYCLTDPTS